VVKKTGGPTRRPAGLYSECKGQSSTPFAAFAGLYSECKGQSSTPFAAFGGVGVKAEETAQRRKPQNHAHEISAQPAVLVIVGAVVGIAYGNRIPSFLTCPF